MKRVNTLYRVSTKGQVDQAKDDIPMQRISCRRYIEEHPDWVLNTEYEEKGISGFKVSAEKRDAIQHLKDAALNKEFDVLLVFMFDHLGRIESETPFVLEWFISHGIEVWSVNEGQQKIEQHVDKLMNYIRFWQAAGESQKTSIRVKTRLQQMTSEGIYTGGILIFGYQYANNGRLNKKGQEMRDLAINPVEAEVIYLGAEKIITEGYGSYQVAELFNKKGFRTHKGSEFQSSNILRLYKNPILRGFLERGDAKSERLESLQILPDSMFFKIQEIFAERADKDKDKRRGAISNKSKALLSGNAFCAHCRSRLCTTSSTEKYTRKDGSVYERRPVRYLRYHRSCKLNECTGATTYKAQVVDDYIIEAMGNIFANITGCPHEEKIQAAYRKMIEGNKLMQKQLSEQISKDTKQLDKLRLEIANALTGISVYTSEDLAVAIQTVKARIEQSEEKLEELKREEADKKATSESIIPAYNQFKTWAETFDQTTFEQKKLIASALFSRVDIGKNYQIHLELDTTYQAFCDEWLAPTLKTATA